MPTAKKVSKKVSAPVADTRDRRCSFRLVKEQSRSKTSGCGPFAIEARQGGAWSPGMIGLDETYAVEQMRRLEGRGCPVEYNEHFQPSKKRK